MNFVNGVMMPIEWLIVGVFGWQPTPLILSIAIGVYAWLRYKKGGEELDTFDESVAAFAADLASYDGNRAKFVEDFEELKDKYDQDRYIGHAWRGYADDIHYDHAAGQLAAGLPPGEFFNARLFRHGRIDLRSFESVPNQLVGLGLLATFVGLVAALLIAKEGIQGDLEASKNALKQLLGTAATKFLTSVAALTASLVFSWRKNRRLHATELHIEAINRELERLVLPLNSERLAAESYTELTRQTSQLERFNQDLAVSIAQALDKSIGASFAAALRPVQESIDTMADKLGDINQSALERMTSQFATQLSGAAEAHTRQLGEMLDTAAKAIGELPGQIEAAGEKFRTGIEEGSKELATSFAAAGENLDTSLKQSSESMAGALRQVANEVEAGAAGVKDTMTEGVKELSASMIAAVDNLDARMVEAGRELSASLGGAAERIEASAESLSSVSERSAALAEKLTETSDALARQFEGALEAARGVSEGLSGLVEQVDRAGQSAEALAELAVSMTNVSDKLGDVAARVNEIADRADATNDRSIQVVEALASRVDVMTRDLGALNNALAAAMQKLFEGLGSFGERTSGFVKAVDKELAEAVGRLSAAVQQLDETLDDLPRRGDYKAFSEAVSRLAIRADAAE